MVTERTFAGSLPENDTGHDVTKALLDDANRQLNAMRAERDALAAKLKALETQKPAYWYLPAEDDDGEDALLNACRDGTSPAVGALPLFSRPVHSSQDARDAERYRFLRDKAQQGAVRTLLPLTRAHYVIVDESAHDYPAFDDAIDAAILAAKEKGND